MPLNLNWRELAVVTEALRPAVEGMFVDRVVVPERGRFSDGYVKGEWAIRLTSRRDECVFIFSVRPRHAYLSVMEGKGPKAAPGSTQSALGLALAKHLRGAKVLSIESLPRERVVVLWFTAEGGGKNERLGLVLSLIPSAPEALLVQGSTGDADATAGWKILARSRTTGAAGDRYVAPDGAKAPPDPPVRISAETLLETVQAELDGEAFDLRLQKAQRALRELAKQARDRSRQSETSVREAEQDPDWKYYGDLMKSALSQAEPPPLVRSGKRDVRLLLDFTTDAQVEVPCDPKLSPAAQTEKFYRQARRRARRITESSARLSTAREALERAERLLAGEPVRGDWTALEKLERAAGTVSLKPSAAGGSAAKKTGAPKSWLGKVFLSKENLPILVGRSRDENLELTFKIARGNDLWMHVRGRPGAHVVIPMQPGKSASLDTLLDAAMLCIHYSGGEKWGKTEVDYALKKYVKRIRDSIEASYGNNKTLIVEPEPARLKRLLDQ